MSNAHGNAEGNGPRRGVFWEWFRDGLHRFALGMGQGAAGQQQQQHRTAANESSCVLATTASSRNSAWQLLRTGLQHGQLASVLRRVRGAGWRNAVFDSTFFGVEHQLRIRHELPAYASFSLAAATALCLDYPIDVAVKRNFAVAAHRPVSHGPILATIHHVRSEGRLIFRGLNVKGLEFAVSYFVTGAVAPLALRALAFAAAWIALLSEGNNDR